MPGHEGGRAGRADRWRKRLWDRLQECTGDDADRLAVVVDHLRVVLKHCVPPEQRRNVVDHAIAELNALAEDALGNFERTRKAS